MKRIGLLGGSFDPPHNAHLALAHAALEQLRLDELRWLPAGDPWQKRRRLASAADREAMLRLAIAGEPRFVLDDRELRRSGPSYTVDTLRELQACEQADWFLVLGQDQVANLHTWHDWPELLRRVTLAVASRGGIEPQPGELVAATPHRMQLVALPPMAVSATEIRERIAAGRDYTDMVPEAVARYIDQHHLYRGNPRS
jgi:nicotinate-nucleotide adenylyltransferase